MTYKNIYNNVQCRTSGVNHNNITWQQLMVVIAFGNFALFLIQSGSFPPSHFPHNKLLALVSLFVSFCYGSVCLISFKQT